MEADSIRPLLPPTPMAPGLSATSVLPGFSALTVEERRIEPSVREQLGARRYPPLPRAQRAEQIGYPLADVLADQFRGLSLSTLTEPHIRNGSVHLERGLEPDAGPLKKVDPHPHQVRSPCRFIGVLAPDKRTAHRGFDPSEHLHRRHPGIAPHHKREHHAHRRGAARFRLPCVFVGHVLSRRLVGLSPRSTKEDSFLNFSTSPIISSRFRTSPSALTTLSLCGFSAVVHSASGGMKVRSPW